MSDNVATTLELKQSQLDYLNKVTKTYELPDRSKALRCLVMFAMQSKDQEANIFQDIRCSDC